MFAYHGYLKEANMCIAFFDRFRDSGSEFAIRTEGLQALTLWEHITEVLSAKSFKSATTKPTTSADPAGGMSRFKAKQTEPANIEDILLTLHLDDPRFNPMYYYSCVRRRSSKTNVILAEDNEAVIKIINKSRSIALRHLPRTHRIDVDWLFEVCSEPNVIVRYVNTHLQLADILTKAMYKQDVFDKLLNICQLRHGPTEKNLKLYGNVALLVDDHSPLQSYPFARSTGDPVYRL